MGDRAFQLFELPGSPAAVAAAARGLSGVTDAVPASDCVGVYASAGFDPSELLGLDSFELPMYEGRVHSVPVCYEMGEDLSAVSERLGVSAEALVSLHTGEAWPCFAIGFCPGFAYLGPVSEPLRGVPRLPSPRVRTAPGSVGLTGSQTAVYPLERPGGWTIIGRTPLVLVDVADGYFPISVGDLVRFVSIDLSEFKSLTGERL